MKATTIILILRTALNLYSMPTSQNHNTEIFPPHINTKRDRQTEQIDKNTLKPSKREIRPQYVITSTQTYKMLISPEELKKLQRIPRLYKNQKGRVVHLCALLQLLRSQLQYYNNKKLINYYDDHLVYDVNPDTMSTSSKEEFNNNQFQDMHGNLLKIEDITWQEIPIIISIANYTYCKETQTTRLFKSLQKTTFLPIPSFAIITPYTPNPHEELKKEHCPVYILNPGLEQLLAISADQLESLEILELRANDKMRFMMPNELIYFLNWNIRGSLCIFDQYLQHIDAPKDMSSLAKYNFQDTQGEPLNLEHLSLTEIEVECMIINFENITPVIPIKYKIQTFVYKEPYTVPPQTKRREQSPPATTKEIIALIQQQVSHPERFGKPQRIKPMYFLTSPDSHSRHIYHDELTKIKYITLIQNAKAAKTEHINTLLLLSRQIRETTELEFNESIWYPPYGPFNTPRLIIVEEQNKTSLLNLDTTIKEEKDQIAQLANQNFQDLDGNPIKLSDITWTTMQITLQVAKVYARKYNIQVPNMNFASTESNINNNPIPIPDGANSCVLQVQCIMGLPNNKLVIISDEELEKITTCELREKAKAGGLANYLKKRLIINQIFRPYDTFIMTSKGPMLLPEETQEFDDKKFKDTRGNLLHSQNLTWKTITILCLIIDNKNTTENIERIAYPFPITMNIIEIENPNLSQSNIKKFITHEDADDMLSTQTRINAYIDEVLNAKDDAMPIELEEKDNEETPKTDATPEYTPIDTTSEEDN